MNEEVKKEENTIQNENVVAGTDEINSNINNESLIDKENINLAPIAKPNVHFESKSEEVKVDNNVDTNNVVSTNVDLNPINDSSVSINTVASSVDTDININQTNTNNVVNPVNNSTSDGTVGGEFIEKDKMKWPIVLIFVLLVLGGAFYYYYFVMTKPSTLFNKVVDATYTKLSNNINNNINNISKNFPKSELNTKLIFTSENADLAMLNGLTINSIVDYDKDSMKAYVSLAASLLGNEIGNYKIMVDDGYAYLNSKVDNQDITYKSKIETYLGTDTESFEVDKYVALYKELLTTAKKTFLENVNESKITKKPLLRNIDGKNVPSYQINYSIDKSDYNKIVKAIANAYMNDNKILEDMVNLGFYESKESVKLSLEKEIDSLESNEEFKNIDVIFYIDMFNNNLQEINVSCDKSILNIKVSGNSYTVLYTLKEEKNTESFSLTYDSNENRYVFDIDATSIIGTAMEEVKAMTDSTYEKQDQRFKMSIVYKENKVNDKKIEYTLSVKYFAPTDLNKEYFIIDATGDISEIDTIKSFDTSNAIDYDSLSDENKSKITDSIFGSSE